MANDFIRKAQATELAARYHIAACDTIDGTRDQNSLVLLSRRYFNIATVVEHTQESMDPSLTPTPSLSLVSQSVTTYP